MFKYRNTVFYDFKSRFLLVFSSNYRDRLVLKIPFPDHIFPQISKYRNENLHFPSTSKYYKPPFQDPKFQCSKMTSSSSNLQASIRFLINVYNFFKISIAHYISVLYTSLYLNNHQN